MKKFKCDAIKGTQNQLYAKIFVLVVLALMLFFFLMLNGYDVNLAILLLFVVMGISIPLVFIPLGKYSAASVEITDKD